MKLTISHNKTNDIVELGLAGRLVLGDEIRYFSDTLKATLADGNKTVLLDLSDLTYMDSAGLGALISGFTPVTAEGGEIKLRGLNGKVHGVLRTAKLLTVFEVIDESSQLAKSVLE